MVVSAWATESEPNLPAHVYQPLRSLTARRRSLCRSTHATDHDANAIWKATAEKPRPATGRIASQMATNFATDKRHPMHWRWRRVKQRRTRRKTSTAMSCFSRQCDNENRQYGTTHMCAKQLTDQTINLILILMKIFIYHIW